MKTVKKLLILIFTLCVLFSSAAFAASAATNYDVTGDGKVDIRDLIAAKKLSAENPSDTRADFNGNGKIDAEDLITLKKVLIGTKPSYDSGEWFPGNW